MPYRRRAFSRGMRPVINSMKNVVEDAQSTGTTLQATNFAKAVNTPLSTSATDVSQGCIIKAIWINFEVCGLAATGVRQKTNLYLIKNPGNNLTDPGVFAVGTSNEKKFIIKQWSFQTMRNQDGNPPNHWEGWCKVPKRYQRMGTDDTWKLVFATDSAAGHYTSEIIYKWYR